MMERRSTLEQARRVFLGAQELEDEHAFRAILSGLACTGLQWGGLLGLLGILILVPVNVVLLGRPAAWWYAAGLGPEAFVLWDKVVVAIVCVGALGLGRSGCRLAVSRSAAGPWRF